MNAKKIDAYLRAKGSPLAGQGAAFIRAWRKHRISPLLLVAIAGAESSFGRHNSGANNPFGWGPGIDFDSWEEAINTVARGLRENYLGQGLRTIPQIGSKYAPRGAGNDPTNLNSHWVTNVQRFFKEIGGKGTGSPSGPTPASNAPQPPPDSPNGGLPDFSVVAFENLGQIARKEFDPMESLAGLTSAIASAKAATTTGGDTGSPPTSAPIGPVRGGITYSGQKFTHDTDGLPGYPAVDIFAKPGTPFVAPENGEVVGHSGKGGTSGSVYGYSVYFQGDSGRKYFITHLNRNRTPVGRRVRARQPLGTVSRWDDGDSHAHAGVRG